MLVAPVTAGAAETEEASVENITRAQWLNMLIETFNMTVEEDNYPVNYYSDITSVDDCYRENSGNKRKRQGLQN